MKLLKFITTFRHVMEKKWRDFYPSQCPVAVMVDGEPSLACMHYLKDDTCPVHGKIYASEKPLTMTPELALDIMWKPKDYKRFTDSAGEFFFDNDQAYKVWSTRKDRGWSVDERKVDITHSSSLTGKRLILDGRKEFTIKQVSRQWYYGAYILVVAEDAEGSSAVLYWEDISLFEQGMKDQVRQCQREVEMVQE